MKVNVKIGVNAESLDQWRQLAKDKPVEAGLRLDAELDRFDEYLESQGMTPLGRFERQIVTEYIGWKLVNTEG